MVDKDDRDNFLTEFQQDCVQLHECYKSFVEAGFSRKEALDLVKTMLIESMKS